MTVTSAIALVVALSLGAPPLVRAEAPPEGTTQEGPALPSVEDEPGTTPLPDVTPTETETETETEAATPPDATPESEPAPESEPPPPPSMVEPTLVRVAVGLSTELDGSKSEVALLDRLEASVRASSSPVADVRRLRVGSAEARDICREGRDDLIISVGYLPDRDDPVLMTRDCRIDQDLGVRSAAAAEEPELLGVLWGEHVDRVANGARERRRLRISPKVRTGLIASAAVAVIGVAVGLLIAGAVQRESVVLVVSPR